MPRLSSFSSSRAHSVRVVIPRIVTTLPWNVVANDSTNYSANPPSYRVVTVNDAKMVFPENQLIVPEPTIYGSQYLDDGFFYFYRAPYLPGIYTIPLLATNSAGQSSGSITINCSANPDFTPPSLSDSIVTIATGSVRSFLFSLAQRLNPSSNSPIYKFSITNLPATFELLDDSSQGSVYGYTSSPSQIALQCTLLAAGGSSTANLLLIAQNINSSVSAPVLTINQYGQTVTIGTPFSYQITATNNPTAYYSTALPTGLSLNSTTGVISGVYNGNVSQFDVKISANNAGGSSEVLNLFLNAVSYVGWALNDSSPTGTYDQVAMNSTGTQQAAVVSTAIYVSSDSGSTWASKSNNNYVGVAVAGNGNIILALGTSGIYESNNFGESWAISGNSPQNVYWRAAAVSSTGAIRTAIANPGRVYVSTNSGTTWTMNNTPPSSSWIGVAMSSSGAVQTIISNTNLLYTSSNSGGSWTSRTISGVQSEVFHSIAMSSTGLIQTLLTDNYILTSSDSGATWTNRYTAPSGYNFSYGTVRMSADGIKQYVAANQRIYKSIDAGVTWTVDNAPLVTYGGLAISSDATKGLAVSRLSVSGTGRAYKLLV
jgi:hypothetical protein